MDAHNWRTGASPPKMHLNFLQVYTLVMPFLEFEQTCLDMGKQQAQMSEEGKRWQHHDGGNVSQDAMRSQDQQWMSLGYLRVHFVVQECIIVGRIWSYITSGRIQES